MKENRYPPFKALQAFESAARHLSFSKAADELFVTPGAISQQVKQLEEFIGVELFKRLHRKILLTDEGQELLPGLREGFEYLNGAVDQVRQKKETHPVTISVAPSFASKWLVPRLQLLRDDHPDVDIRLDASMELVDLARSDIDIGIRFGPGEYPGLEVELLLCEEVFPVCSPQFASQNKLNHPSDLKGQHLLHFGMHHLDLGAGWPDWQMWLSAAGVTHIDGRRGLVIDNQELLINAALESQGVVLVGSVSVNDDIARGRLIKPFELTFPLEFAYYLVTVPTKTERTNVTTVKQWIFNHVGPQTQRTASSD